MKLITKRMTVMSLTPEQMMMYIRNVGSLEKELTISYQAEPVEGEFRDLLRKQARLCEDYENDYLWHTFWMFHLNRDFVGAAHFDGFPNRDGEIRIFFHTGRDFMGQGYATEAVSKLAEWALRQEGVKSLIAETERDNIAAQRVLEKSGFEKYKATETSFWWIINAMMLKKLKDAEPGKL